MRAPITVSVTGSVALLPSWSKPACTALSSPISEPVLPICWSTMGRELRPLSSKSKLPETRSCASVIIISGIESPLKVIRAPAVTVDSGGTTLSESSRSTTESSRSGGSCALAGEGGGTTTAAAAASSATKPNSPPR